MARSPRKTATEDKAKPRLDFFRKMNLMYGDLKHWCKWEEGERKAAWLAYKEEILAEWFAQEFDPNDPEDWGGVGRQRFGGTGGVLALR